MQNNKQELENKLAQIKKDIEQKQNELDQKKLSFNQLSSDKRKIIINPEDKSKTVKTEGDCDLLALDVDAIVNAANDAFHGGGGIDGVIGDNLNEGGKLYDEARKKAVEEIGEPVAKPTIGVPYPSIKNATGKGVLTDAYPNASFKNKYKNSPIKYVAHMVAPSIPSKHFTNPSDDEKKKLYGSIRNAFELVKEKDDVKTIGFPAIGCGVFGWSFKIFFETMFNAYKDFVEKNLGRDLKIYIAIYDPSYGKSEKAGNLEFKTSKLATNYGYNLFEQKLKAFKDEIKNLKDEIQKQKDNKKAIEDQIKNLGSKDINGKKLKALKENYDGEEVLELEDIKKLITDLESKLELSESDFNSALKNVKVRISYEFKKAELDKLINKYKSDDQYKKILEDQEIKSIIMFTYSSLSNLDGSGFTEKLGEIEYKINLKKNEMDNELKNKPKIDKLLAEYKNNDQYEKILEVEDIKDLIAFTIKNVCKAKKPKDFDDYLATLKEKIENRKRIMDNHAEIDNLLNKYKNNQYKNIFEIEDIKNMIQLLHDKLLSKKEDFDKNLKSLAERLELEKKKIDEAEAKAKISDDEINKLKDFWLAAYKVIYFSEPEKLKLVKEALDEKDFIRDNLDAFKSSIDDLKKEIVAKQKNIKDVSGLKDEDIKEANKILEDTSHSREFYNKLNNVVESKVQRSLTIGGPAGFTAIFAALTVFLGAPVALPFVFGGVAGISLVGNLAAHKIINKKIESMNKASKKFVAIATEKASNVFNLLKKKNETKDKTPEKIKDNDGTKTNQEI